MGRPLSFLGRVRKQSFMCAVDENLWGLGRRCCWADPAGSPLPWEEKTMVELLVRDTTLGYNLSFRMSPPGDTTPQ